MKKKFMLLLSIAISSVFAAYAQPTLTAATNAPVAGDVFFGHDCDSRGVSRGAAGSGITWNLSTLTEEFLDTVGFVPCSVTPYCDSFPGSNLAIPFSDGSFFTYLSSSSTALQVVGEYGTSYHSKYGNPWDFIYFPMSYHSYHSDSVISQDSYGDISYIADTSHADAYGTLMLPSGTYSNVLRVHTKRVAHVVSGSSPYSYKSESYVWFAAGFRFPLLVMEYDTSLGIEFLSYVAYYTSLTTGIENYNATNASFKLSPNPATATLQITTSVKTPSAFTITNTVGAVVMSGAVNSPTQTLNISDLPTGLYYVKLTADGMSTVQKFIKE